MKKRTWFILILAIALIVTGATGSIFYFQRLEAERAKSDINKKFKYDNSEELVLNVKNRATLYLSTSEDDYVHMKKQGLSYGSTKNDETTWDIQKSGNQTVVTTDNKNMQQRLQPTVFSFGDIYDDSISLSLPENYKKITIKGNSLDINSYDLSLSKLDITTKHGNISADNLTTEELNVDTTHGDVYFNGGKVEKGLNINANSGDVTLEDTSFSDLSANLKNGDILTANTKGNISITNNSGNTNINHTKGKVTVDNKSGDIVFHSNQVNYDVDLATTHGNILIEIDDTSYERNKVDFQTGYGAISIFNKNLSSESTFSRDKGKNSIKAVSKNGDIVVNKLDKDDTEYGAH